jgi:hypothetical protein
MSDPNQTSLPNQLLWLADAPLFIDGEQIESFYDAVVRPYYKQGLTQVGNQSALEAALAGELGLEAEFDSGKLIELMAAWLPKLKATASGKLSTSGNISSSNNTSTEWHPIETPQRQLEQLVLHYLFYQPERLFIDDAPATDSERKHWTLNGWIQELPRGLVLLDFPPGTKFIPTFGEYGENHVVGEIFKSIPGETNAYPTMPTEIEKRAYWNQFVKKFDLQASVVAVETGGGVADGRIQVIDYRVPISDDGRTLHLHLHPRGNYPTITFAYNMIRRGFEHGLRIVGTMKSEPDMNVLGIYEK